MKRFLWAWFYWTYTRGSWQWDLFCLFFLLIIFTTPHDFLESYTRHPMAPDKIRAIVASFLSLN
jgi:hypothetical protein